MRTNIQTVSNHRDLIKRKKKLKNELKLVIILSFLKNRTCKPIGRSFFKLKFLTIWKKQLSESNQQNICVWSGKKKSSFKISNMSRQLTKNFIERGLIQNVKIK